MKMRDAEVMLKDKCDPAVVRVIISHMEETSNMQLQLRQMGQMVNQMVEIISNFSVVAENMKGAVEKIIGTPKGDPNVFVDSVTKEEMNED